MIRLTSKHRTIELTKTELLELEVQQLPATTNKTQALLLRGLGPRGDQRLRQGIEKAVLDCHVELLVKAQASSEEPLRVYQLTDLKSGELAVERVSFLRFRTMVYDAPSWLRMGTASSFADAQALVQRLPV